MAKTKKKAKVRVEDHGNGFMVVGVLAPDDARKVLDDYVDNIEDYRFACPTHYDDRSCCWLTTEPGAVWDGATYPTGEPMPR